MLAQTRKQAFTLLEILIVLIILSLVALIGVLSLSAINEQQQAKSASEQLTALIQFASDLAVLQQQKINLVLNPKHYQFFYFQKNTWHAFTHGPLTKRFTLPSHIQLTSGHVAFYANQTNTKTTIIISNQHHDKLTMISLQANGKIQQQVTHYA